jgi:low temperature requirement protein LtrA
MFASLYRGGGLDIRVMVLGYAVMRVALLSQWWRASRHDRPRRRAHYTYIVSIAVSQVLWCVLASLEPPIGLAFALLVVPFLIEIAGPFLAERHGGTPWHPHHVAERYGLMVLIALGEGMLGTMANLTAAVREGISLDLALLVFAGTALTFGLWWMYFVIPHGEMLTAWRRRSFAWGYGHIPLFGSIVAIGAGLDISGAYLEGEGELTLLGALLAVAAPLGAFLLLFYLRYALFTLSVDPFHLLLVLGSAVIVAIAALLAAFGVGLSWDLAVLSLTPWVTVLGYETVGYRHNAVLLERTRGAASASAA